MKSLLVFMIFSFLLLGGSVFPAMGQSSSIGNNVVINEVDINPPGDDSKTVSEWAELYNPTSSAIDLSGWKIASTTVLKKTFTIPEGTIIQPGKFLTYSYQSVWFTDVSERIELRDSNDVVVDSTPTITDLNNDFTSWQRKLDGLDSDSLDDWKFVTSTAGSSNGQLSTSQSTQGILVSISSDKTNYIFGETAILSGTVSEQVFVEKPTFAPEQIKITIDGPNYFKTVTLYPDISLNFKTSIILQKVLGISKGFYDVTVNYAGSTAQTEFFVGDKLSETIEFTESELKISTDKESYLPSETVTINGFTTEIIPLEGLKFLVIDPNGLQIYQGQLFPTVKDSDSQFSTTIFMSPIESVYGTYEIIAEYSTQKASTTFELVEDFKESQAISLSVDKPAYGLGDIVVITGRLNNVWLPSLDFELLQTGFISPEQDTTKRLKILDAVRIDGDGKFRYEYKIPNDPIRFGEYLIKVSKEIGEARTVFSIVENPDEFIKTEVPLSLKTNKSVYDLGEKMIISGKLANPPNQRASFESAAVSIDITDADGNPVEILGKFQGARTRTQGGVDFALTYTAIPDIVGNFKVEADLPRGTFEEGKYFLHAKYNKLAASTSFAVQDPLVIGDTALIAELNKDIFGLGETVHLIGKTSTQSAENALTIILTKPSGNIDEFGTTINDGVFDWSWTIPSTEKIHADLFDPRSQLLSNYGTYKIELKSSSGSKNLVFKVSANPESDSIFSGDIFVTTGRPLYQAGEKLFISGNVVPEEQGKEGLVVPERVHVIVKAPPAKQLLESFVAPDSSGFFQTSFVLPPTVFNEGTYTVTAEYLTQRASTVFDVTSEFLIGDPEEVGLIVNLDKDEYHPGETVKLVGKPNKIIFLEKVDIAVLPEEIMEITCGAFVCGEGQPVKSVVPDKTNTFRFEYKIPDDSKSIGKYTIKIKSEFDIVYKDFIISEKPITPKITKRVIEKFSGIEESTVPVKIASKTTDDTDSFPRVLQGSLVISSRGQESDVNLQVSSEDGTCIIGPASSNCLVTESTRAPGTIYQIIEVEEMSFKVRYNGPDAKVEKFTILPESSDALLPDSNWIVEVLKQDQLSKFYYKVTYNTLT